MGDPVAGGGGQAARALGTREPGSGLTGTGRSAGCRRSPLRIRATSGARRRSIALLVLASVCLVQIGCGFRLRGAVEIPAELNPIYIQSAGGSPVRQAILEQLAGSDVVVAPAATGARLILRVLSEASTSRVVAVDARGRVLAYELHYLVNYDAVAADGSQKVPAQSLDLVRNFDNPDVEVLGKQLEERLIFDDFARDAADRILMRLRVALL